MKFNMNQKMLKNINICVIIVGLCLFSMWCGAVINGANATANTIDLSGLTPEESGGIPINYVLPNDVNDKFIKNVFNNDGNLNADDTLNVVPNAPESSFLTLTPNGNNYEYPTNGQNNAGV